MGDPQPNPATMLTAGLVAVLLVLSAVTGLLAWRRIYASETDALVDSVAAQDVTSLIVAILLIGAAIMAARTGSALAILGMAGLLWFVAYNAAIYCFSVHFGPLFLVWTALLGLSVYGAVTATTSVDRSALSPVLERRPTRVLAWVLIGAAVIFTLLWLKEIVPDLLAGRPSTSAAQWQVPTNPVHILDLALYLPACLISGLMLLRGEPLGLLLGVPSLVWLILTCIPILLTPALAPTRGHVPDWAAVPPVAVLLIVFLVTLGLLLNDARKT